VLERGAMARAFLETYVVTEILKSYRNRGRHPKLGFYRDHDGHEVNLVIADGGTLADRRPPFRRGWSDSAAEAVTSTHTLSSSRQPARPPRTAK
jgi:hypothetical protein